MEPFIAALIGMLAFAVASDTHAAQASGNGLWHYAATLGCLGLVVFDYGEERLEEPVLRVSNSLGDNLKRKRAKFLENSVNGQVVPSSSVSLIQCMLSRELQYWPNVAPESSSGKNESYRIDIAGTRQTEDVR
jgi:hypothetical protein